MVVVLTDRLCVRSAAPVKRALLALPCLYALTTFLMVALTLIKSKPTKEALPFGAKLGVAALLALLAFSVLLQSVRYVNAVCSRTVWSAVKPRQHFQKL